MLDFLFLLEPITIDNSNILPNFEACRFYQIELKAIEIVSYFLFSYFGY